MGYASHPHRQIQRRTWFNSTKRSGAGPGTALPVAMRDGGIWVALLPSPRSSRARFVNTLQEALRSRKWRSHDVEMATISRLTK